MTMTSKALVGAFRSTNVRIRTLISNLSHPSVRCYSSTFVKAVSIPFVASSIFSRRTFVLGTKWQNNRYEIVSFTRTMSTTATTTRTEALASVARNERKTGAFETQSQVPVTTKSAYHERKENHTTTADRSREEIRSMMAQRISERESWTVHGVPIRDLRRKHSPPLDFNFYSNILPKLLFFTPPDQAELDEQFPVQPVDWNILNQYDESNNSSASIDNIQVTWMGHSTVLVQMDGYNILTDPIFSNRCSPIQWMGPKRYRRPPCTVQDLMTKIRPPISSYQQQQQQQQQQQENHPTRPPIDVVLISHNHYDHLDYNTIMQMLHYSKHQHLPPVFVVPLGLKSWFHQYVSKDIVIHEMDWHESVHIHDIRDNNNQNKDANTVSAGLQITCLPMRHWTNRVGDQDQSLWCGYKVTTTRRLPCEGGTFVNNVTANAQQLQEKRFLFAGDTSWFDEMKELVGTRHGPFDVAAIPIGAYEPWEFMKNGHINPPEAVLMKDFIGAKYAIPIHYGTFPLTIEPVLDPIHQLLQLMKDRNDRHSFCPWLIGNTKQFPTKTTSA